MIFADMRRPGVHGIVPRVAVEMLPAFLDKAHGYWISVAEMHRHADDVFSFPQGHNSPNQSLGT
jgi:hypothetical protein